MKCYRVWLTDDDEPEYDESALLVYATDKIEARKLAIDMAKKSDDADWQVTRVECLS